MGESRFDPGGFYDFRLDDGAIASRSGRRVLILSDAAIGPLVTVAVQNGDLTAVRRFGRELGDQVKVSLGRAPERTDTPEVLEHAAGVMALYGFGRLSYERWGDALVLRLDGAPALDDERLGLAALLGGAFSVLSGSEVACVPVDEAGRFLVVSPTVAEQVWIWSKEGADLARVVSRLAHVARGTGGEF